MFELKIIGNSLEPNFKTFSIEVPKVYFSKLSKSLDVNSTTFFLKDEFHITIIGRTISKEIYSKLNKTQINIVLDEIRSFIETYLSNFTLDFEKYYLLKKKYYFENHNRVSIIQTIDYIFH